MTQYFFSCSMSCAFDFRQGIPREKALSTNGGKQPSGYALIQLCESFNIRMYKVMGDASITKQKIYLKKILGCSQILTIQTQPNSLVLDEISLSMLESKTSKVVVLFLSLFSLVLCTANSMHLNPFLFNLGIHQQGFGNNVLSPKFFKKTGGVDNKLIDR